MIWEVRCIQNEEVFLPLLQEREIELFIKREDQIHPEVSGNKFRKLKYNLLQAKEQGFEKLLTFGGAFSNHILATAVAGKLHGFKTVGVIRGEELGKNLTKTLDQNVTLKKASDCGMELVFVSREAYRRKNEITWINSLKKQVGNFYLIPEGGTNSLAVKGCEEILTKQDAQFDYICSCVGTGGTISGLINRTKKQQKVFGFPALKGDLLTEEIRKMTGEKNNWEMVSEYHFGGYSKYSNELIAFINDFKQKTSIPLDPIYTGKMMYGIIGMIQKNQFPKQSKILAIHTGGIQGINGFNQRLNKKGSHLRVNI